MAKPITAQIHFFGPYIEEKDIFKILNPEISDLEYEYERSLLNSFFDLPMSALSKDILARYVEVTAKDSYTSITPHTKEIFERLLKPLKSAKKNYCLGDYSSTIALCGIVGEMLAILLWKINDVGIKDKRITEEDERGLFGMSFEKLGQDRKLKILKTFGHINDPQYKIFETLRESRRPYLHWWTVDLDNERSDALDVLKKAFNLFKEISGIGLADAGTIKLNPLLIKFMEK